MIKNKVFVLEANDLWNSNTDLVIFSGMPHIGIKFLICNLFSERASLIL